MSTHDARPRRLVRRLLALLALLAVLTAATSCAAAPAQPVLPPPSVPVPAAPAGLTAADVNAWLDGTVPADLERAGIAGAAVSVVHDGRVLTARGYGHADTGSGDAPPRPVDPAKTLFRAASISKTFTATAVLQLVEQGRVDLDAEVGDYLDFDLPQPRGPVTVRHLLTHTAGFEERVRPGIEPPGTPLDLRGFITQHPPEQIYAPGTLPAYSNYGNSLLGYVVQRVTGEPFADYVQREVLDRAGMRSSTFVQPLPAGAEQQMSAGYADAGQPAQPFELVAAAPAGALSTTATDMARFLLAQLGELEPAQSPLRPETRALMQRPGLGADALGTLAEAPRMTLGFFDESRNGHRILGHDGDTRFFHSRMEFYPDDRTGIFLTVNSTGRGGTDAYELRESLTRGFSDRYFPDTRTRPAAQPTAGAHAAAAAGTYESSRSLQSTFLALLRPVGQTTVSPLPDGRILVEPAPGSFRPAVYEEVAPWVWRAVDGQDVLAMQVVDGRVEAIGHDSAFALLRADTSHRTVVAGSVAAVSVGLLLLAALSWPVTALVRRHHGSSAPASSGRVVSVLRRVGVLAALLATLGWAGILSVAMNSSNVGDPLIRAVQALQLVGVLAIAPAAIHLVRVVRARGRWTAVLGGAAVLVGLAGLGWIAVTFRLLALDVSY